MNKNSSRGLNIGLWVAQGLLALAFGMAGAMKAATPIDELAKSLPWVTDTPVGLVRFIGTAEFAAALGMILPSVLRIKPILTPLAGAGLVVIMSLAAMFHLSRGEAPVAPVNLVLGGMAAFVAWGRYARVPIAPRE
jgi:predicted tellurium resistance membrane protein TerC